MYIRCFWQKNHQLYGHIRCIYTVRANPTHHLSSLHAACSTAHVVQQHEQSTQPTNKRPAQILSGVWPVLIYSSPSDHASPVKPKISCVCTTLQCNFTDLSSKPRRALCKMDRVPKVQSLPHVFCTEAKSFCTDAKSFCTDAKLF